MPDCDCHECDDLDALVVSARSDREAFGRLYETYYERILSYCLRRLYRRSAAEDVCSEVFLYVARKMRGFRGTTDQDFRRWVYRIATTEVNAYLRKSKRRQELWHAALEDKRLTPQESVTEDDSHDALDHDAFDWPSIYQALSQLNDREQTVVTLRLFDEMSYNEIANVLNVRAAAARVTYNRAIKRLRDRLSVDSERADGHATPRV